MKTFECQICGHLAFSEAPNNCPICGAPKGRFKEIQDATNKPADPNNLTDAEKKHTPVVNILGNKVEVTVGQVIHPMTPEHHIMYVDFYINDKGIKRSSLGPSPWNPKAELGSEPKALVELNLQEGQELKVLENCNLHGRWVTAVKV